MRAGRHGAATERPSRRGGRARSHTETLAIGSRRKAEGKREGEWEALREAKDGQFFHRFFHGGLPSIACKQRPIFPQGSASHAFLSGAGNARIAYDRHFSEIEGIVRMR